MFVLASFRFYVEFGLFLYLFFPSFVCTLYLYRPTVFTIKHTCIQQPPKKTNNTIYCEFPCILCLFYTYYRFSRNSVGWQNHVICFYLQAL
ncbi:Uncharacterized protein APZ42_019891 [Daphnia magna]|uniref:Uncharacterized protein n=1 Tax=Daphnia magna TaxID=35525 RepID=A0A0P6C6S2_9CRUS|nr:Uncharacterized protein APZ42_019891 [Daphnia magna]